MRKFSLNLNPWSQREKKNSAPVFIDIPNGKGDSADPKVFGIKSYLHNFYLTSPTIHLDEVDCGGSAKRTGLWICRIFTVIGLVLLLAGAVCIIASYCLPLRSSVDIEESLMRIAIDQDEDGNFYIPPERFTEFLRDPMHTYKIVGFCAFATGASLLALSLLIPACAQCALPQTLALEFVSEDNTPNDPPIRVYPAVGSKYRIVPTRNAGADKIQKISPTSINPIPMIEEISKVQPRNGKKSPNISPMTADELLCGGPEVDQLPLLKSQY